MILAGLLALTASLHGQDRPSARAVRTEVPPRVDGVLDDAAWDQAIPIGPLTQAKPLEGEPASERTEVRILFDDQHLYVGVRCLASEPSRIIATTHERDGDMDPDDRVAVVLDTFLDRRDAYYFQVNAAGAKSDARITGGGSSFNHPWDGIWEGRATRNAEGWAAELAIPFQTLTFEEGQTTWGLNVRRIIGWNGEHAYWSGARLDYSFFNVTHAGDLTGLGGFEQGLGLDVVPFFSGSWRGDVEDGAGNRIGDSTTRGATGVDAFYRLTPSLNLGLTVNTDFAETEVDARQNNLTRFPLFFPEKRDFFLQDAGLFGFTGEATPFFSRRIGLTATGEEVPILAGARLTGRVGDYSIGLVDVQTDSLGDLDGQNLFATRVTRDVGEQSSVGAILTHGDPDGSDNTVHGVDARYRTSEFQGDKNLSASAWALHADAEGVDSDQGAFGASVSYPNDLWSWYLSAAEIQEQFDPALGFVSRRGIRRYAGRISHEPRPNSELVRRYEVSLDGSMYTTTGDDLETFSAELQPFGVELESGDGGRIEFVHTRDVLFEPFEIREGIVIPSGDYDLDLARLELDSSKRRPLSAFLVLAGGEFYEGMRRQYRTGVEWRPGPLFQGSASYEINDIELPAGDFTTHFTQLRGRVSFNPSVSWNSFLQWDNESEDLGLYTRLGWILEPGRDVFVVLNETLSERDGRLSARNESVAFKIGYTLRF